MNTTTKIYYQKGSSDIGSVQQYNDTLVHLAGGVGLSRYKEKERDKPLMGCPMLSSIHLDTPTQRTVASTPGRSIEPREIYRTFKERSIYNPLVQSLREFIVSNLKDKHVFVVFSSGILKHSDTTDLKLSDRIHLYVFIDFLKYQTFHKHCTELLVTEIKG